MQALSMHSESDPKLHFLRSLASPWVQAQPGLCYHLMMNDWDTHTSFTCGARLNAAAITATVLGSRGVVSCALGSGQHAGG